MFTKLKITQVRKSNFMPVLEILKQRSTVLDISVNDIFCILLDLKDISDREYEITQLTPHHFNFPLANQSNKHYFYII
jgi:hypothetical protein